MPYVDTMMIAMDLARSNEQDDSFLADKSIHEQSILTLHTKVSDELNASKQFEQLLQSQLMDDLSNVSGGEVLQTFDSSTDSDSLFDLVKKEQDESRAFEEYLQRSLLDET